MTVRTLGEGMILHSLRRRHNIFRHKFAQNKATHTTQKGGAPQLLWFTYLSVSSRAPLADLVAREFTAGAGSWTATISASI